MYFRPIILYSFHWFIKQQPFYAHFKFYGFFYLVHKQNVSKTRPRSFFSIGQIYHESKNRFQRILHTCFKNSNVGIELYLIDMFCFDFEWQDHEPQYFESLRHGSVAISSRVNLQLVGMTNFVLTKKTFRETLASILTNFVNDNYKFVSNLQLLCHGFRTRNAKTTFWVLGIFRFLYHNFSCNTSITCLF